MKKVKFIKEPALIENPVFLEGISRSGKFFLGKLVSALDKAEYFQYATVLEHLPYMQRFGVISEDATIALLRSNVDEHVYHMKIGRNLNFRCDDASSLVNSPRSGEYLKRAASPISKDIVKEIRKEGRYYPFVLHEGLPNIGIFFKAFPAMRWISLRRHPVDLVHSLYRKGWGHRLAKDPLAFIPIITTGKGVFPWYVSGWEEEYVNAPEMDGIINCVSRLIDMGDRTYLALTEKQKRQVLAVRYEDLVENTMDEIGRMAKFLKASPIKETGEVLRRERCPQKMQPEKRAEKERDIKNAASKKMYGRLMRIASIYEEGR